MIESIVIFCFQALLAIGLAVAYLGIPFAFISLLNYIRLGIQYFEEWLFIFGGLFLLFFVYVVILHLTPDIWHCISISIPNDIHNAKQ